MRFHKPLFSVIVIIAQLILSIKHHFEHLKLAEDMKKSDPELFGLICYNTTYTSLFFFVFIIGLYEMLTKPSWFKTVVRIFLVCIILGTEFSDFIPIDQFYYGVYNTAWFSAVVAIVLTLVRIGKYGFGKIKNRKLNKASR